MKLNTNIPLKLEFVRYQKFPSEFRTFAQGDISIVKKKNDMQ